MSWFVFQPQTVADPYLGSGAMINTLFYSLLPHQSQQFMYLSWFTPPSCRPPISSRLSLQHLSVTPAAYLISWHEAQSTWTYPILATRQLMSLVSAPHDVCLLQLLLPRPFSPPIAVLGLHPGPCHPLRVQPSRVPPCLCVPDYPSLCSVQRP